MSATQTSPSVAFISSGAEAKPTLFCLGEVASIAPARLSKSGENYVNDIVISPIGNATQSGKLWFTWNPEFLRPGYNTRQEENTGLAKLYDSNIIREHAGFQPAASEYPKTQRVGLATLQGLCGSEERFAEVAVMMQEAYSSSGSVDDLLPKVDEILQTLVGTGVGYVLKQQFTPTAALNEAGYPIKVRGKYYEVAGLFYPTDAELKRINAAVDRALAKDPTLKVYVCFSNE